MANTMKARKERMMYDFILDSAIVPKNQHVLIPASGSCLSDAKSLFVSILVSHAYRVRSRLQYLFWTASRRPRERKPDLQSPKNELAL